AFAEKVCHHRVPSTIGMACYTLEILLHRAGGPQLGEKDTTFVDEAGVEDRDPGIRTGIRAAGPDRADQCFLVPVPSSRRAVQYSPGHRWAALGSPGPGRAEPGPGEPDG